MTWQEMLFLFPYLLSAVICAIIGLYAYQRRSQPSALAFSILAGLEAVWTISYVTQLLAPSLAGKLFWNNAQFLGAVGTPAAFFAFSVAYSGRRLRHPRLARTLVAGGALAMLLFIWTDGPLHHLFRTAPHLVPGDLVSRLVFTDGPAFNLYTIYAYLLLVIGTVFLMLNYTSAPRVYRLQIGTVMVGILIPWVTTFLTWLNFVPVLLHDVTPLTFAVSNLVVGWALFRYGLFEYAPIAYTTLVEQLEDGVLVTDNSLRIVDMNPAAQHIFGLSADRVIGQPIGEALPLFAPVLPELSAGGAYVKEIEIAHPYETRFFEARLSTLSDNRRQASGRLVMLRDITNRRQAETRLRQLAATDPLTGLYNRRFFFALAEREFQRAHEEDKPLSVILMDVDYFKQINDTYGHPAGDLVLEKLAQRSRDALRRGDSLARYGGEEFAVLLPETDLEAAVQVAERLRVAVAQKELIPGAGPVEVTVSLGVATLDHTPGLDFDRLVDRADRALYMAKRESRNRVCVWEEDQDAA